jgi:hypothetical protein
MAAQRLKTRLPKIPKQTLIYIGVCLFGMIGFLLVAIVPNQSKLSDLDDRIQKLEFELRKQEVLFPVFTQLRQKLQQQDNTRFKKTPRKRLSQTDIAEIPTMLRTITEQSGLTFNAAVPDVNTLKSDSGRIRVKLSAQGDFFKLRDLLFLIYENPYVDEIDQLAISSGGGPRIIGLLLWFAVEE